MEEAAGRAASRGVPSPQGSCLGGTAQGVDQDGSRAAGVERAGDAAVHGPVDVGQDAPGEARHVLGQDDLPDDRAV
ncbi:hypothetical protein EBU58_12390, partial [bacterium]|nr:hypothetical protein [bacterium]